MQYFDYDTLFLDEHDQIQRDAAKAIALYHSRKRKEAKAELDAIAKKFGFGYGGEPIEGEPTKV